MNDQLNDLLTHRAAQLLSRYLGTLLVATGAVTAAQADAWLLTAAQILVALALFAFDHVVSRIRSDRKVEAAKEEERSSLSGDAPGPWNATIVLLAIGLVFASGIGCASSASPQVQAAQRSETFRIGMKTLNASIKSGKVSKEQARRLAPYVLAANKLLDETQRQANDVATLQAQLKVATTPADKAEIQAQLDVAQDAYLNLLKSLDAALDAFDAATENPDVLPEPTVNPTTRPVSRGGGVSRGAGTGSLAGTRQWNPLRRAA
jgi:hypothetical protein